ncbi:MAG: hypothetical protein QOI86_3797 [Actinomycetota bacterium]|jgi:AcrR family transcriptional regulator|nr:hypothetical protein [Actinomycetota bacterium]
MPDKPEATVERILDGALQILGRFGSKKLSIVDVADEVGCSRATVYRYFPGKPELMEALNLHEKRRFERELRAVATAHQESSTELFRNCTSFVLSYAHDRVELRGLLEADPSFMIRWLRQTLNSYIALLDEVLKIHDDSEALAEIVLRLGLSVYVFPDTDIDRLVDGVCDLFEQSLRGRGLVISLSDPHESAVS